MICEHCNRVADSDDKIDHALDCPMMTGVWNTLYAPPEACCVDCGKGLARSGQPFYFAKPVAEGVDELQCADCALDEGLISGS